MAASILTINKLQRGINAMGGMIVIDHTQFYSKQLNSVVAKYTVKQAYFDESVGRTLSYELFSAYSQIQIIFYLRDHLYHLQGKKIPDDNYEWEVAKRKYYERYKPSHKTIYEEDREWAETGKFA